MSRFQYFMISGMLFVAAYACTKKDTNLSGSGAALNITIKNPVDRDWAEIKEEGILRMITRYSSNSYFLHRGLEYGFEYELLNRFAQNHDLSLEVVVLKPNENPYDKLNSGKGDVIAANYTITDTRKRYVDFTRPYNLVSQVIVFSDELFPVPKTLAEIARRNIPVTVRPNSSYYHRLKELQKQGVEININLVENRNHTEALLIDVSQGRYTATVADNNIFQAVENYMDHLVKGPVIAKKDSIAWPVRKNANNLKEKLNQFISKHFRFDDGSESPKSSAFLNILKGRYFESGPKLAQYYYVGENPSSPGIISPYDELFKEIADSAGIDWLMLAAIAAQESHFNPNATGWGGAVGLMQIMPEYSLADSVSLYDPEVNIRSAVRMLTKQLKHYAYLQGLDRWRFVLAAYNAGQGHIADARRLAIDFNKNPNKWENTADALIRLMGHQYYKNARYGFVRGVVTVQYVREIINRYQTYQIVLVLFHADKRAKQAGLLDIFE